MKNSFEKIDEMAVKIILKNLTFGGFFYHRYFVK